MKTESKKIKVSRVCENSLMVYFGETIDTRLVDKIAVFTHAVQQQFQGALEEVIPSYTSVFIAYHPLKADPDQLVHWCQQQAEQVLTLSEVSSAAKVVSLPVYYHPEVAPDLQALAQARQLTVDEVIEIHSQTEYTVCAIGFAPGFAFLGSVDPRITMPRHAEPRMKVAKGSVGIADSQTAVYPLDTPGGWQIIGNCPVELFNMTHEPMMPFEVGDKIRFQPMTREAFLASGGSL
ncbi:Kinase A inhibitor [Vibrio aerogenes CECT 7868]|uniref:Kinase A inhibitor n=1 Tax=Vibrio aerogenes CECT 7868 TaxID=1216006 RepID=A0A1M5WYR7_9VIBR|nr:5-oxoprolinase subunit PxpB [Vibrio aerogenes]SHH92759.1 Kinase A inhibitor [Vibrio aerogenes CECT 7868]